MPICLGVSSCKEEVPKKKPVHKPFPLRINCGGEEKIEKRTGSKWLSDKAYVTKGKKYRFKEQPSIKDQEEPAPKDVYQTARRLSLRFRIKQIPDGIYKLRLHFMDDDRHEKRRMEFWAEGKPILQNFNIKEAAGGEVRATIFETFIEVTGGDGLELKGSKGKGDDVILSGIEIDEAPRDTKVVPFVAADSDRPADFLPRLREFTGGPVRLVWTQTDNEDDYYQQLNSGVLMGYDSEDGKGERIILPDIRSYAMPVLTPDGKKVIFTDQQEHKCFEIGFDGKDLRELVEGYASDVWADPATGRTWLYVRTGWRKVGAPVFRYDLSDLTVKEPVWEQSASGINQASWFTLSGDGKLAADGFPWPQCGVADLGEHDLKFMGKGCWPSIAPDSSGKYFYFIGKHTAVQFYDTPESEPRFLNLSTIPGWTGRKLYHPRWTNDVRFITATAPQWMPETELYLGKFDAKFEEIEKWFRVTYNERADFFGDAWFANAKRETSPVSQPSQNRNTPLVFAPTGLAFIWENERAKNSITDEAGKMKKLWSVRYEGLSRPNRHYGADIKQGGLAPSDDAAPYIASRLSETGQLSMLFDFTSRMSQNAPGTIASFAGPHGTYMAVEQHGENLVVTIATDSNGEMRIPVGKTDLGKPHQLAVTLDTKNFTAFIDGKQVASQPLIARLNRWKPERLFFGHDAENGKFWAGALENIRIYERILSPEEISGFFSVSAEKWQKRKDATRIVVEAELVEASEPADPDGIAPYTRSLGENLYRVIKAEPSNIDVQRIVVLQWVILGGQEIAPEKEIGKTYRLVIEPESEHAELSGEHRSTDLFELDAPVFYDVES